jgi:hypothetical protein
MIEGKWTKFKIFANAAEHKSLVVHGEVVMGSLQEWVRSLGAGGALATTG